MSIITGDLYHVYNRRNNRDPIFFKKKNYYYFLDKMRQHIVPNCDLLAYCLMPNHFHFMIRANGISVQKVMIGQLEMTRFSKALKDALGAYAKGINKQENRTGSLFTHNTTTKALYDTIRNVEYSSICFNYIHQNPLKAKNLVKKLDDWPYSSFHEFMGTYRNGLCNISVAKEVIYFDWDNFYEVRNTY